jgi:hypothetical protein
LSGSFQVPPVTANPSRGSGYGSISFADYEDWKRETAVFEKVALWRPVDVDVTGAGDPERVVAAQVTEEFFPLVDAKLVGGRTFTPADHEMSAHRITVLSHAFWQRRFGGDPNAIGRTLTIAGTPV